MPIEPLPAAAGLLQHFSFGKPVGTSLRLSGWHVDVQPVSVPRHEYDCDFAEKPHRVAWPLWI